MNCFKANWRQKIPILLFSGIILFRMWLLIPVWGHSERFLEIDSLHYLELTKSLIQQGRYLAASNPELDLVRPPGYPLFMMPGILLGAGDTRWVSIYQVLLSFVTAWLLYKIGQENGQPRAGLIASLFYLVNPNAVFWSMVILTETLSAFLITSAFYSILRFHRTEDKKWLFIAGIALGYATLTRPIIIIFGFIWIIFLVIYVFIKHIPLRHKISSLFIFICGFLLLVFPWQIRNQIVHGVFSISIIGQSTIEDWMVAKVVAEVEGISRSDAVTLINQAQDPRAYSLQVIRKYPGVFVKEQIRGILRTLLGSEYVTWARIWGGQEIPSTGFLSLLLDSNSNNNLLHILRRGSGNPWFLLGLAALAFDGLLYGACIFGFFSIWRLRADRIKLLMSILLVISIVYLVISPFAAGESRFRAPADPLLAMLAGFAWIIKKKGGGNHRPDPETIF